MTTEIVREPPRRSIDRHVRELVIAGIGIFFGASGILISTSRESGATQQKLLDVQAQLAKSSDDIRQAATNYNNLLLAVQSQAIQVATLTAQVSALLQAQRKP